jgi:hypothetical protein
MTTPLTSPIARPHLMKLGALAAAAVLMSGVAAQAQGCPDWRQGGMTITTDSETAWVPQSFAITAGGPLNLAACPTGAGPGHVNAAPSFTLTYDDRQLGRDLDLRIESQNCDTVLLINDYADTWHYNDDEDGGLNARLRLAAAPSGRYDIWVGTYGPQTCQATLVVETFPPAVEDQTFECPEWSLGGVEVSLSTGQSSVQTVVAGGGVSLFERGGACGIEGHGYVATAPDFTIMYDAPDANAELMLSVSAQCDTVLLVNDLNAAWLFNDDTNGFDPMISIPAAASGRYDVWVGTFGEALCDASFSLSSVVPQTAPTK